MDFDDINTNDYEDKIKELNKKIINLKKQKLKADFIQDENKTVLENKLYVSDYNHKIDNDITCAKVSRDRIHETFKKDLINAILDYLDTNNELVATKIYLKAYDISHSYGLAEIVTTAEEISDFIYEILHCAYVERKSQGKNII